MGEADKFTGVNPLIVTDIRSVDGLDTLTGKPARGYKYSVNPFQIKRNGTGKKGPLYDISTYPDGLFLMQAQLFDSVEIMFDRINTRFTRSWVESTGAGFLFQTIPAGLPQESQPTLDNATATIRTVDNLKPVLELGLDENRRVYEYYFNGGNVSKIASVTFSHYQVPGRMVEIENDYLGKNPRMEVTMPYNGVNKAVLGFILRNHRDRPIDQEIDWDAHAGSIQVKIAHLLKIA